MEMFTGEQVLLETRGGALRLTTHRVRLDLQGGGHSRAVSMTLDAVASCGLVTRSYPVLLALALISALLGGFLTLRISGVGFVFLGLAVVLLAGYFIARSSILEIKSAGDKIQVHLAGSRADVVSFIDAVENAKLTTLDRGRVRLQAAG